MRCFPCHAECVDSLRLAMDTFECSSDDAANWLLDPAVPTRIAA